MQTFFVEIKCKLGKTYAVASALADREIASEIYSTAGNYDILAKFHIDDEVDIGHFVAENVQTITVGTPPSSKSPASVPKATLPWSFLPESDLASVTIAASGEASRPGKPA